MAPSMNKPSSIPLLPFLHRFKRDISESEDTNELFSTIPQSIIGNISEEEHGNFSEEVLGNTTTEVLLDTTTEVPQKQEPIISEVKQIVTQEYPTYNLLYSDNMAKDATFLGMVRDGEIAAKQRVCFYLP